MLTTIKDAHDPYFVTNTLSAILGMNAWLWSTVFHVHDFPMTEVIELQIKLCSHNIIFFLF